MDHWGEPPALSSGLACSSVFWGFLNHSIFLGIERNLLTSREDEDQRGRVSCLQMWSLLIDSFCCKSTLLKYPFPPSIFCFILTCLSEMQSWREITHPFWSLYAHLQSLKKWGWLPLQHSFWCFCLFALSGISRAFLSYYTKSDLPKANKQKKSLKQRQNKSTKNYLNPKDCSL